MYAYVNSHNQHITENNKPHGNTSYYLMYECWELFWAQMNKKIVGYTSKAIHPN